MHNTSLSTVIDEFPTMLFAINSEGAIVKWNKSSEELTGFHPKEAENKKEFLKELVSDSSFISDIVAILQSEKDVHKQFHSIGIVCKNGDHKIFNFLVRHRKESILDNLHTWVIGFDETEQYQLSQSLLLSNKRFEMISNATNDAVWEWDIKADTLWWGEGIHDLFGHPEGGNLTSFSWWSNRVHPDDCERVVKKLRDSAQRGENSWRDEYRFKRKDGTYSIVSDRGWTIFDEENKVIRMIGGMTDISEKKIYEQSLIIKNQQLSEYAFFNSHKVRAPLARLLSCVNLLQVEGQINEDTLEILNAVKSSAEDLDKEIKAIGQLLSIDSVKLSK
jgi:PAS domain S-box-containing protein